MRIAQIAPIIESVPPKKYGGTERVVSNLTEALVKLGHDVTLFASGDSATSAKLVSVVPKPLREVKTENLYGANAWTLLNIGLAYKFQNQFDIIHDHNNDISLPTANLAQTPVVITLHGAFNNNVQSIFEEMNKPYLVTISKSQSKPAPHLNYVGNVYNGLDMQSYPFSNTHKGYLLYVGRISYEKGVHLAIKVAQSLNLSLIIAAKLETESKADMKYFETQVKPHLKGKIRWIGEVNETERNVLMSQAMAFLHPLTWQEPFGLTLIEAMACGAPVIAFPKGSIPELIVNNKTGFVVKNLSEMIKAVKKIDKINRQDCRDHALKNFNSLRMAQDYEKIYQKVIDLHKSRDGFIKRVESYKQFAGSTIYAHTVSPPRLSIKLKEDY